MNDSVTNELSSVQAVYCKDGEFTLHESSPISFTIFQPENRLKFCCALTQSYPREPPTVQLLCPVISRSEHEQLNKELQRSMETSNTLGEPMLYYVISWVTEKYRAIPNSSIEVKSSNLNIRSSMLIQLDHMRTKSKYVKILEKWASELNITGFVSFLGRLIYIGVHGHRDDLQEFVLRLKTQKVDIDSKGHPCKEKMMNVLCQVVTQSTITSFEAVNLKTGTQLRKMFSELGLDDMFEEFVPSIYH